MKQNPEYLDLERLLAALRRRWWAIALVTIVVVAAAYALSERQTKLYTATTSVLFQNPQLSQEESGVQVTYDSPSEDPTLMATNIQVLAQQSGVAGATARAVGQGLTAQEVQHSVSVAQQGQTSIAQVSATSTKPALAAAIANAFAAQFISSQAVQQRAAVQQAVALVQRQIKALSPQQLAGTTGQALLDRAESLRILARLQNGGAQVIKPATVPTSPSSPKVTRNTAIGIMIGLLLGLMVAFLLERLDRRMKNVEDLEAAYQVPLLATVPQNKSYTLPPQLRAATDDGQNEVFRLLRAYLRYFNVDRELRSLLVASAAPGDGKSTVARNLAQAAQETGTTTLLVEADLRRPTAAAHYGIERAPGLSELLIGGVCPEDAIQAIPVATRVNGKTSEICLDVLTAGNAPPNPAELMGSKAMTDLLAWAAEHYDLVVIDTPPVGVVSDAMPLLTSVDGVVLVSHLGKNTRDAAAFLRQRLLGVNAPVLGVVANGIKSRAADGYGYGYYDYDPKQKPARTETTENEPSVR